MASEQSPAFQFYPRDFVGDLDVAAMTLEQAGAYAVLLSYAWLKNGLPNDFPKLARALHISGKRFDAIWEAIGEKFTLAEDGRLRNDRQEEERAKQQTHRTVSSEHGKAGARARWSDGKATSPAIPEQCPSNTQAIPSDDSSSSTSSSTAVRSPQPPVGAISPIPPNGHRRLTVNEVFPEAVADDEPALEARLAERWTALYAECRNGAMYRPHPVHDYSAFRELVLAYPDAEHLDKMIRFFLCADDLPDWAKTRSPKCFLRLAPETDAAVRGQRR